MSEKKRKTVKDFVELVKEWHPTKNLDLRPENFSYGSKQKIWWLCRICGFEWQATPNDRIGKRSGCPACAGRVVTQKNSLESRFPDVALEWHPTKNGDLRPTLIHAMSNKKVWWRCKVNPAHEWEAAVANRTGAGTGCPYCAGKRVCYDESLKSLFPELAEQWHPTLNEDVTPDQVTPGSDRLIWWICKKGPDHVWKDSVRHRALSGTKCPFCSGRRASVTNSLATLFPEIAKEWHVEKNGDRKPEQFAFGSKKKCWWQCSKNPEHQWDAAIASRTRGKNGCPFCRGLRVIESESLAGRFPELAKQWHPIKNGEVSPYEVSYSSNKPYWWKCPKGPDHEWPASPNRRTNTHNKSGCPFCGGIKVSVTNSLATLFPDVAKQWHFDKNGNILPEDVLAGTHQSFWWKCPKGSDHEWPAQVKSRTYNGRGCPFCAGKKVSVTNSLASLFPDIAGQWHPGKNGGIGPRDVTAGAGKKYSWKCDRGPDHEWMASPKSRTSNSTGCPFCRGLRPSVTNSLASLYPEIAAEWDYETNNGLTPDLIVSKSNKKMNWICSRDPSHRWPATVCHRTLDNSGCPHCQLAPRSKQEIIFAFELAHFLEIDMDKHKVSDGNGKYFDVDVVIPEHTLAIEFDSFYTHQSRFLADLEKTEKLSQLGWRVIRVREEPLEPVGEFDVVVPVKSIKKAVECVLCRITEITGLVLPNLNEYIKKKGLVNREQALKFIKSLNKKV